MASPPAAPSARLPRRNGGERQLSRLADLAAYAGVSEATVSRVLNDRPGVAEGTRKAVLTALDVLGYERPSKLRRTSAGLVGLIIPELTNPVFPHFAQEIESHLAGAGYTPVLCTMCAGGVREDEYVDMLLDRGVSAIIFVSGYHADTQASLQRYHELVQRGMPIVLVNGVRPDLDATFVSHDDVAAVRLAVEHLRGLGHTRIGFASGPGRYVPVQLRLQAYLEAMADVPGVDPEQLVQRTFFTIEGGAAAGRRLVEAGATAAICGSDVMALGVITAVRRAGLEVPREFSVVGSDDFTLAAYTDPPLTTVRMNVARMAEVVVTAALDSVRGHRGGHQEFLFAPELVVRASTASAPVGSRTS